jgi:hypothetical protein
MSEVIQLSTHNGWSDEETALLWQEVRACSTQGQPLRVAFDKMAALTGRKANSIRNYYYAAIKSGEVPGDVPTGRAMPFTPFSADEIDSLLREVLMAQGRGISVRACVTALGGGDRAVALRLQNKYRALLKSHPDRVMMVVKALQEEGQPCVDPFRKMRSLPRESTLLKTPADSLARHILARAEEMSEGTGKQYLAICLQIADLLAAQGA